MAVDGGAKRRRGEQGDRCEAVVAGAIPADRISALPDELRQRILTHLPLKDAIRTGLLARGWRGLWKSRWAHLASVEIHLDSSNALRELDALARERRPRRRLDRFSLAVSTCKLRSSELRRFLDYAAECQVEDLHIEVWNRTVTPKLSFHLPLSSPLLARLSLRHINISRMYYKGAQPFRALEVIRLHEVSISQAAFKKMMALCSSLRTLNLRRCKSDGLFHEGLVMPPNLQSITIAGCDGVASLNLVHVPSLLSFWYTGDFRHAPFCLPRDASLSHLFIRFANSVPNQYNIQRLNNTLPKDLSGLVVLTICCNALPVASSLSDDGASAELPELKLHSLRELQVLMLKNEAVNLADLYVFLKACQCPNLERLFVQLPEFRYNTKEVALDEVREEPPEDSLNNLMMVKIKNFNWHHTELQLVSFLLRKASSLHKLLIVSPKVIPLDVPGAEADLLLLKEALANGKLVLCESDDAATQPYHSDVFIEL